VTPRHRPCWRPPPLFQIPARLAPFRPVAQLPLVDVPTALVNVRELQPTDHEAWLDMRSALWPHCTSERHVSEMHTYFSGGGSRATFVAAAADGSLCGFIEASLRPCAEGCTTQPVGYIEGIYVQPTFRRRGIARSLVAAVERWAASRGCVEFASDCHHDNEASIRLHLNLGFAIAKRLVHFRRAISNAAGNV
jgi:aminoglycoside 6'-N-acetyltransferase I